MQLHVRTRNFSQTQGLLSFTRARANSALSRFQQKVISVNLILSDINGPKGGEDKKCVMCIHLGASNPIVIQHIASDMYDAISHCCARAKQAVAKQSARLHSHRSDKQHIRYLNTHAAL